MWSKIRFDQLKLGSIRIDTINNSLQTFFTIVYLNDFILAVVVVTWTKWKKVQTILSIMLLLSSFPNMCGENA
jgi:hypothetical protein